METFKFTSESSREMDDCGGGKSVVDAQVKLSSNKREQGRSVEECATAVTKTSLVQIRPKPSTLGEKDFGVPTDISISDGEQEYHKSILGPLTDHDGGTSAQCDPHTREGAVQRADSSSRMEFEGGGETLPAL